ncbi:LysM peptidoglycan-binding domain-containing protein [Myroides sp. 1354]|uniref:LysM peptidoglycan-binding domain-containing protein n=1 Tax=unclassified Myroides TaxID=2642485 RepID=UPI00257668C5|nr:MULTISPECIES: LysM peptidoglycan-binding domain-containing protein [unclassified Myroides]MDM1046105.1 LysM peptidoglycan-binding domain-containing protein [Myroides sp. R163-1]MDM1057072.1 LysM peptidoglycan-binding domain-containing protein [Myroides sp. 1354]MDM1070236.1 LysM peptidoglycan-binding domain-containing protein [Myroides sp. 1372]
MMRWSNVLASLLLLVSTSVLAQQQPKDQEAFAESSVQDTLNEPYKNRIYYPEQLKHFFQSLKELSSGKRKKVNIVHIGDSHIQADFFSGRVRNLIQEQFGNGGLGFTFPYQLARTNSNNFVRYSSNSDWENRRNIYPVNGAKVGLSGIALSSNAKDAIIKVDLRDSKFAFTKVKLFTPNNELTYRVGTTDRELNLTNTTVAKTSSHKIKSGESLSGIAKKYNTTVAHLKQLNKLKSANIQAGKTLIIPTKEIERPQIATSVFHPVNYNKQKTFFAFDFPNATAQFYLYAVTQNESNDLNGLVLENDQAGIVYHTIGVNGARYSDYNKYPLFFDQLEGLEADLIILSLGTNEAFDKIDGESFKVEINRFLKEVKSKNPQASILVTSPPPSYFSKGNPNTVASTLANEIIINGVEQKYAIWDMYYNLGGTLGLPYLIDEQLLSKDLVHYTIKGYEYTGTLFFEGLMKVYQNYFSTETEQTNESI